MPSDHIVAATGEIANANEVLSRKTRNRLREASKSDVPIFLLTQNEAYENELKKSMTKLGNLKDKSETLPGLAQENLFGMRWFPNKMKNNPVVMAMSFSP
ncbi:MAG: hypothetical protein CM15mP127_01500 [Gammaproteobacteria bacterium]|nr:MAG: hypothetical protein CM15mP127_01500 [Gammaproteobacteria bacterium]